MINFKIARYILYGSFITTVFLYTTVLKSEPHRFAVLQGLDKVTARTSTFVSPVGEFVQFGTLKIIARICKKKPPEETPESAAFLDISEIRVGEPTVTVYRGWMFASSPAIAAMEHPVYDVWVLDCKMRLKTPSSPSNNDPK